MEIEHQFHLSMEGIYHRTLKECKYNARYFWDMLQERGAIATAKTLIHKKGGTEGFTKLWELNRLDLTIEALVLQNEYRELFDESDLKVCQERLGKLGYPINS